METHRHVLTWNYEVVHVHGKLLSGTPGKNGSHARHYNTLCASSVAVSSIQLLLQLLIATTGREGMVISASAAESDGDLRPIFNLKQQLEIMVAIPALKLAMN
jgi:hypothetical protein